jgi:hypothetical protein
MNIQSIIFYSAPVITLIGMLLVHGYGNLAKLRDNWSQYRCNPIYMPFAGLVDPKTGGAGNFSYCLNAMGKTLVSDAADVVSSQFSIVSSILAAILAPLKMFRSMLGIIRNFVLSFTNKTLGKAMGPVSAFSYYLNKIQDLFRRMVGEGYIAAFFGVSFVSGVEGFVSLALAIIKGFVLAMLIISFVLALFQPELLAIVLFIASALAMAGV